MFQYESYLPLKDMADAAVATERGTQFPALIALAMWACESHWGQNITGDFNYWGITRGPEMGGGVKLCATHEWLFPAELHAFRGDERNTAAVVLDDSGEPITREDGRTKYSMQRWFASYPSAAVSMTDFVSFIIDSPSRYKTAWRQYLVDRNTDALLSAVCDAGYATGDAKTVELTIAHQSNIAHAIEMARASVVS